MRGLFDILCNFSKLSCTVSIGHVKCDHNKHSEKEEIEAHFFAAQDNAPNVLIKTIAKRGYKIDVCFLMEYFGLSEEAAQKKMGYLK